MTPPFPPRSAADVSPVVDAGCNAPPPPTAVCTTNVVAEHVLGQITSVRGDVVVAGRAGLTPASVPAALQVGDAIVIGRDGVATVVFGAACQDTPLPSSSTVTVRQEGRCAYLVVDPKTGVSRA